MYRSPYTKSKVVPLIQRSYKESSPLSIGIQLMILTLCGCSMAFLIRMNIHMKMSISAI